MSDKQWHGYYPEPLREAPKVETEVFSPEHHSQNTIYACWDWRNDEFDICMLQRGRLHLTREAAEAQARFEIEQAGGVVWAN